MGPPKLYPKRRFKDMSDGTYAEVVYVDGLESLEDIKAISADVVLVKSQTDKISSIKCHRDIWCSPLAVLPTLVFTDVAADKAFPSVSVPSGFLPVGAVIDAVYPILSFSLRVNSGSGTNAINGESKTIRAKLSVDGWDESVVAFAMADGAWSTPASKEYPGLVIVGADIKAKVTSDNVTVNFCSEETNNSDAIVVDEESLILYDVAIALRFVYHV
jgi:hypothetical protein